MVNSISLAAGQSIPSPQKNEHSLSREQQSFISETLSQFDSENLSSADAKTITSAFAEAGIPPGIALGKAMSELGFNAKAVGKLAGLPKQAQPPSTPPTPPKQSTQEVSSMIDYLTQLIEEKLTVNNLLTDEDKQSIMQQVIEKFGIEDSASIIDTKV